jgi:hypothetical protein
MPGMTVVNPALIPAPNSATSSTVDVSTTGEKGYFDSGDPNMGAFRSVCVYSHMNFDDAIVFPGQPGASHLHVYFGNTSVTAATTPANLPTMGNGTCRGGTLNRSAYWIPAMVDTRTGAPQRPQYADVYYKSGYQGSPNSAIKAMPVGLRIVAGDSKNTVVMARWESHVEYGCNGLGSDTIPNCGAGSELQMKVVFPQCWDGTNLDAPDHKSHMAYGTYSANPGSPGSGCPSSHPVALPEITIIAHYPAASATGTWRLSSDRDGSVAGTSGHGDWMNGWTGQTPGEYIPSVFVAQLLNKGLSGGSHIIGDGRVMDCKIPGC